PPSVIDSPGRAGPNGRISVLRRPPGRFAKCSRNQVPKVPAAPVRSTGRATGSDMVILVGRAASPAPASALERRGRLGLSILRCQELEILILAVLNMIDAELRERPRISGLEQVE